MSGPRDVFAEMREHWLTNVGGLPRDRLADDVVVETPFAPPDHPRQIEGRDAYLARAGSRWAGLPVRIVDCREVAVHDTTDPEVIVVEYELDGELTATGEQRSASFVGVLRVRDGKVLHWRQYQDTAAIARALSGS